MNRKSVLALSGIALIIVILLILSSKDNIFKDLSYSTKTNKKYVEKTYNVDVVRSSKVNKDYFFIAQIKIQVK